ncbi:hypothetical protein TrVE_jg6685 [Triparma verrucosa]|uniref:DUF4201 domain-containing protein n=1 Tax=Triparma verrucosa TaxID=1606542 RepID=A0A9W7CP80_9STRA|nr:hypothetical protein TrVE_jg6685 [Triparma verrucosa]
MAEGWKEAAIAAINEARENHSASPLVSDPTVTVAADAHAAAMADGKYTSHWNEQGEQPYQRYYLAGCNDHVTECVYGQDSAEGAPLDMSPEGVAALVKAAQGKFSNPEGEDMPKHLAKEHTHVAIGIFAEGGTFRYVEVYIDRHVDMSEKTPSNIVGSDVTLSGTVLDPSKLGPYCCIVYYESPQGALDASALNDDFAGPYFDYSENQAAVVWPWEISYNKEDGNFSIPVSFSTVPEAGNYYVKVFLKGGVDSIPYEEKEEGLEVPGPGVTCATSIVLTVTDKTVDSSADHLALSTLHIETGTIEERQAISTAVISSQKPDPNPITEIVPLAGVGLVVPDSTYEHNLFVPVERQESGTIGNLTLCYKRAASAAGEGDELGLSEIRFLTATAGEDVQVPPGFTMTDVDLCKMLPDASAGDDEEKKEGGSGDTQCFLAVRKEPISDPECPPLIVDVAVVYAEAGFEMGGGYVSTELPKAVCEAFQSPVFVCTKVQGAGKEAADKLAEEAAAKANNEIADQLAEDGSMMSEEKSVEEINLETDLTKEEMLDLEDERAMRLAEQAERDEEEAQEKAEQQMLKGLQQSIESLERERNLLTREHSELQKKLAAHLASQKRRENTERNDKENMAAHEMEKQYNDTLTAIVLGEEKLNNQKSEYDKIAIDLQTRLDEKECKANEISQAFRDFKREISRHSENSRTGKPMPKKVIAQFEQAEIKKDEEAERVRLKNINLKMTVKKLENNLRAKEQLAEGLHLIDFEQLKIENQTLNEKIEERNEELHKLRKKNTTTVQVLTHIKEKLQAVQADNAVTRSKLTSLDSSLSSSRDRLTQLKRSRELIRASNVVLKQKRGFANSELLVVDFDTRKVKLQAKKAQLAELMERHTILEDTIQAASGL